MTEKGSVKQRKYEKRHKQQEQGNGKIVKKVYNKLSTGSEECRWNKTKERLERSPSKK